MHYVGIDLHKRYVSVCALDKGGKVVSERRRLSHTAEGILAWLGELRTVPGIGSFTGLLIAAEVGTIERLSSSHELASYAGLVPSIRSSGGKTSHGSVGRAGSSWLKWALVEVTQTLKRSPGPVGFHYQRLLRSNWSYEEWLRQHERSEVRPVQTLASVG